VSAVFAQATRRGSPVAAPAGPLLSNGANAMPGLSDTSVTAPVVVVDDVPQPATNRPRDQAGETHRAKPQRLATTQVDHVNTFRMCAPERYGEPGPAQGKLGLHNT
jgi:hypothetical protein